MAENGPFGAPFLAPKIPPKKFMWAPFLRPFPGNEAHKLFSGGPNWGVLGGGPKVYVEQMYVLLKKISFFVFRGCLVAHRAVTSLRGSLPGLPADPPERERESLQ